MKEQRVKNTGEFAQLIHPIKIDRAQMIFLPKEDALFYLKESGYLPSDVNLNRFPEMPAREYRYIRRSWKVNHTINGKLNQATDMRPLCEFLNDA